MIRVIVIAILLSLFAATVYANAPGFQDIPFGTSYAEVKTRLIKAYGESALYPPTDDDSDYIWIRDFEFGDYEASVTLFFDHKSRLYAFKIQLSEHTANYFKTSLMDDAKYINQVFINKYGKPSNSYKPHFFNVESGYTSYLSKWNKKDLTIYTGLSTYEFKYYALGYVGSKKMIAEHNKFLKNEKINSAKKAVEKF